MNKRNVKRAIFQYPTLYKFLSDAYNADFKMTGRNVASGRTIISLTLSVNWENVRRDSAYGMID